MSSALCKTLGISLIILASLWIGVVAGLWTLTEWPLGKAVIVAVPGFVMVLVGGVIRGK